MHLKRTPLFWQFFVRWEESQNESSSKFLNFCSEFCPPPNFASNFPRIFFVLRLWETETRKNSPKVPTILQWKIPRQIRRKNHKSFLESGQSNFWRAPHKPRKWKSGPPLTEWRIFFQNELLNPKWIIRVESPVSSYRVHRCALGYGPPPDGFPPWQSVRVNCSRSPPLKNPPPLFVPWVTMGGPTHVWVGPPISLTH